MRVKIILTLLSLFSLFHSCSDSDNATGSSSKGDSINRTHNQSHYFIPPPERIPPPAYPWEKDLVAHLPKITKEFFRCKGSSLNPERIEEKNDKTVLVIDCGGSDKHSLPLKDHREFIYPILINLFNHLQSKTGKRVVITSGHRCPDHNSYIDSSYSNSYSKHTIGAEVSFYVQGMEFQPQKIIDILLDYYSHNPEFNHKPEFSVFHRYKKYDTNVSTQPWYNKEVFLKLFKQDEGRNLDNRHPYPYISIQVRHDTDLNEKVRYSWEKADKNYLRR